MSCREPWRNAPLDAQHDVKVAGVKVSDAQNPAPRPMVRQRLRMLMGLELGHKSALRDAREAIAAR